MNLPRIIFINRHINQICIPVRFTLFIFSKGNTIFLHILSIFMILIYIIPGMMQGSVNHYRLAPKQMFRSGTIGIIWVISIRYYLNCYRFFPGIYYFIFFPFICISQRC